VHNRIISIVVPVYQSTKSIEILSNQIVKLFDTLDYRYEIIFVNDSPLYVQTSNTLKKIKRKNHRGLIKVITMKQNRGQQYALLCGLTKANGNYIITMDDDLQHPVSEIPKLISAIENDPVDLIFAKYKKREFNLFRNLCSWLLNKIDNIYFPNRPDIVVGSFRIFHRKIVPSVLSLANSYPALSNLLIQASTRVINVEVKHAPREYGKSNYTLKALAALAIDNIINYTALPLALLGIAGLLTFVGSLTFIVIIFIQKLFFSITMPGYASTVILITFFGGLNLLGLGIIGEYLIRIIREQNKPKLDTLFTEDQ